MVFNARELAQIITSTRIPAILNDGSDDISRQTLTTPERPERSRPQYQSIAELTQFRNTRDYAESVRRKVVSNANSVLSFIFICKCRKYIKARALIKARKKGSRILAREERSVLPSAPIFWFIKVYRVRNS